MMMYRDVMVPIPHLHCPILTIVVTYYHNSMGLYRKSDGEQAIEMEMSNLLRSDLSFFQLSPK